MIARLREKLWGLQSAVSLWLRERRRRRVCRREPLPVLRGSMHRVLVLRPPDKRFTEAIFILRDDYFQTPGLSRQALLRQAKDAAEDYLDAAAPAGGGISLLPSATSAFALGAACAILALWLAGLLR